MLVRLDTLRSVPETNQEMETTILGHLHSVFWMDGFTRWLSWESPGYQQGSIFVWKNSAPQDSATVCPCLYQTPFSSDPLASHPPLHKGQSAAVQVSPASPGHAPSGQSSTRFQRPEVCPSGSH